MAQKRIGEKKVGLRKILITGANGFVGTALCHTLVEQGFAVRRTLRRPEATTAAMEDVVVGDIGLAIDWRHALRDVEGVVHLAARAHVMRNTVADPLKEYRNVNVLATRTLLQAARNAGVRRFVFLSSIKVNGEQTKGKPFTEHDMPHPEDDYGVSKWEAELVLQECTVASSMETVVLRPPLLYGPGVKGNFLSLLRAIDRGLPLPLASIDNRRSLLYVGNLIDAIMLCLDHPAAAGKTYLLADDDGVSTPALVRGIAHALGKPARLLPFPPVLLKHAGALAGKAGAVARLLGSLQIDSNRIRRELGWRPRTNMAQGLAETVRWYHRPA